jgi:hypothetical protein
MLSNVKREITRVNINNMLVRHHSNLLSASSHELGVSLVSVQAGASFHLLGAGP